MTLELYCEEKEKEESVKVWQLSSEEQGWWTQGFNSGM